MEPEARKAGLRHRGSWRRTGLEEAQTEGECRTDSQEVPQQGQRIRREYESANRA